MGVKEKVFRKLDEVMKPGAILATNTSTLDVEQDRRLHQAAAGRDRHALLQPGQRDEAARDRARRERPAKDVLATVMALAKKIKKIARGLRRLRRLHRQPHDRAVPAPGACPARGGRLPQQVDRALEEFGFAMGPFRMGDLAGNDIGWHIRKRRYAEKPGMRYSRSSPTGCASWAASARRPAPAGTATSRATATPIPDPVVNATDRRRTAKEIGITPRKISDEEIVERCVYALVNEGAHILEEGIAQRASDIDIVYLTGYGFPRLPRRPDASTPTRWASPTWSRAHGAASPRCPDADAGVLEAGAAARHGSPPRARSFT